MSFAVNQTFELWRSFMPGRKEIKNAVGTDLYSLEVYDPGFFHPFRPEKEFEKWAAVQVSDFDNLPPQIETMVLPSGLYAVFTYKGLQSNAAGIYNQIFLEWLPASGYVLDNRPHFALMGEKYKREDPDSEEEIWIPIQ